MSSELPLRSTLKSSLGFRPAHHRAHDGLGRADSDRQRVTQLLRRPRERQRAWRPHRCLARVRRRRRMCSLPPPHRQLCPRRPRLTLTGSCGGAGRALGGDDSSHASRRREGRLGSCSIGRGPDHLYRSAVVRSEAGPGPSSEGSRLVTWAGVKLVSTSDSWSCY